MVLQIDSPPKQARGESSPSVKRFVHGKVRPGPAGHYFPYTAYSLLLHAAMQSFPWVTGIDCLAASLFLYLFVTFRDHRRRRGVPYPPGPPPLPVIGNILDVPKRSAWVAYQTMSKKYGTTTFL